MKEGMVKDLLPPHSGTFEKAVGVAVTDSLPVPIRQTLDPAVTPEEWLPFLAAHDSVDLWYSDWSVPRKRAMVSEAPILATLKGTRHGAVRFLSYVDAVLVDVTAYPAKFFFKFAIIGRTPINHPPFLANYLVKVETSRAPRAFVIGRSFMGQDFLMRPDREKFKRALVALRAAKAPETEIRVDFAHMRQIELSDAPLLDGEGEYALGDFVSKTATPLFSDIWPGLSRVDFSNDENSGYVALLEDI